MTPKISVTIPFYNRQKLLTEAIKSLLSQTFSEWECFLVDDGSDDRSSDIAQSFVKQDDRFKYYRIDHSGRPGVVKNTGVMLSTAPWACVLDSDDLLTPDALQKTWDAIQANPQAKLFYTHWWDLYPNGQKILSKVCNTTYSPEAMLHYCIIFHLVTWNMDLFREIGGFDLNNYTFVDDFDLHLRLSEVCEVCEIKEPLYIYRRGFHDQVSSKFAKEQADNVGTIRRLAAERKKLRSSGIKL